MIVFNGRAEVRGDKDGLWRIKWYNKNGSELEMLVDLNELLKMIYRFIIDGYELIVDKELDKLDSRVKFWRELHYVN